MAITDLTGTKWLFNETLISSSEFSYSIDFKDLTDENLYDALNHQIVQMMEMEYNWLNYSNQDVYDFSTSTWINDVYKTIEITGGTDVTNATLISWLERNATQIIENKKYLKINSNIIGFVNNKKISSVDSKPIQSGKFSFKDKIILTNQKSIAVTTNFSDFTLFSNITNSNILDVCYANGILAMIVNSNTNNFIYTRDEGKTWTSVTLPITRSCHSLMYANGFWSCCRCTSNSSSPSSTYTVTIAKSTDLVTWTTSSYTCNSGHTYVYSNGYFIRDDYIRSIHKPYLYYSTDLVTWIQQEVTTEYWASGGSYGYSFSGDWEYISSLLRTAENKHITDIPLEGIYYSYRSTDYGYRATLYKTSFNTAVLPEFVATKTYKGYGNINPLKGSENLAIINGKCVADYFINGTWSGVAKIDPDTLTYSYLFTPDKPSSISATIGLNAGVIFACDNYAIIHTSYYDSSYHYTYYLWNTLTDSVTKLWFLDSSRFDSKVFITGTLPPQGYSGNISTAMVINNNGTRATYIKFDTPPSNYNDYDAFCSATGQLTGSTSYTNKTKIYIWGSGSGISINNVVVTDGGEDYSSVVEFTLTEDCDIYLNYWGSGGSND